MSDSIKNNSEKQSAQNEADVSSAKITAGNARKEEREILKQIAMLKANEPDAYTKALKEAREASLSLAEYLFDSPILKAYKDNKKRRRQPSKIKAENIPKDDKLQDEITSSQTSVIDNNFEESNITEEDVESQDGANEFSGEDDNGSDKKDESSSDQLIDKNEQNDSDQNETVIAEDESNDIKDVILNNQNDSEHQIDQSPDGQTDKSDNQPEENLDAKIELNEKDNTENNDDLLSDERDIENKEQEDVAENFDENQDSQSNEETDIEEKIVESDVKQDAQVTIDQDVTKKNDLSDETQESASEDQNEEKINESDDQDEVKNDNSDTITNINKNKMFIDAQKFMNAPDEAVQDDLTEINFSEDANQGEFEDQEDSETEDESQYEGMTEEEIAEAKERNRVLKELKKRYANNTTTQSSELGTYKKGLDFSTGKGIKKFKMKGSKKPLIISLIASLFVIIIGAVAAVLLLQPASKEVKLTSVTLSQTTTTQCVGENLDLRGLKLKLSYSNNTYRSVDVTKSMITAYSTNIDSESDYLIVSKNNNTFVAFSYSGETLRLNINVNEIEYQEISEINLPQLVHDSTVNFENILVIAKVKIGERTYQKRIDANLLEFKLGDTVLTKNEVGVIIPNATGIYDLTITYKTDEIAPISKQIEVSVL